MKLYAIHTKPNIIKRSLATIIDYTILFVSLFVISKYFGKPLPNGGYKLNGLLNYIVILFWPLYIIGTEIKFGATPGHRLFRLKILSINSNSLSISQVIKRRLCDIFDILWLLGLIAFLCAITSPYNQRLGDIWAKTIVVDTTDPEQYIEFIN
jgi:uncharacterized RDD family membrane protein YckC